MIINNEMPDRWYSTKEICAYLGISRDTMLVWIATKNMDDHKVGRNSRLAKLTNGSRVDKRRNKNDETYRKTKKIRQKDDFQGGYGDCFCNIFR